MSETYSKLKNTIPDFLNNNQDLKSLILKIEEADENAGGSGALIIKLKNYKINLDKSVSFTRLPKFLTT